MIGVGEGKIIFRCDAEKIANKYNPRSVEFRAEFYLERDGQILECPWSGRVCGPRCPHFQIRKSATNGYMLTLTCGRGPSMTVEDGMAQ